MYHLNVWLSVKEAGDVGTVRERLATAAKMSRTEPGCERFEVYQSQADERRFLLVEWWESKAAWEAHRQNRAVTEIYVPQVLPYVDRDPHPSTLVE
ncbi:MAG TPA: antibiotic biosynthesis monooxygenase family protein [Pirellulales bacterium]|nr:antibiotic biosynthesis monooxygenase family protein [Pirellulales bacterium]